MPKLRIASYNIHCGVGIDGRFDENRILEVVKELDADVVALQEVESRASGIDILQWLSDETGYQAIFGSTLVTADGTYGNGLLARCGVTRTRLLDLSFRRREPRGAISADLQCGGEEIRIVATHLGLRPAERREQVDQLLKLFRESPDDRAALMGDLNEWFLWGRPLRKLHSYFCRTPALATFPAMLPFLALDRIWAHPPQILANLRVHNTKAARRASDHLPLVAELHF